jgi:transposase-like protein
VTANTLFHDIKMPLLKAFYMVFRITAKKKGMSTLELGTEVGVQQKTAWLLKRKIQSVMKETAKLQGKVDVDETLVGGYAAGKENRGRSLKEKTAVVVAIERLDDDQTGNINFTVVENFEKATLKYALQDMIEEGTTIRTDQLSSYEALKTEMPLETVLSQKGSTMEELHKQVMMFKNWLRGTHHKCSEQHLHAYLDEYKYRFNRRNIRKNIFDSLIVKMMNAVPITYKNLKNLCAYST